MGRPTPEAILSKLIRKYFKFDLRRKTFQSASKYLPQLQSAWEKNGMDSKEAMAIQDKIDASVQKDENDYIQLKKSVKKYPMMMNKILAKPQNKHQKKADGKLSPFKKNLIGEKDSHFGHRI
jgi:hypothetical protein